MKYHDPDNNERPFIGSLLYTKDGDLDLSWLFVFLMGMAGIFGFMWCVVLHPSSVPVQLAGWSFLAGAFASVLIAAIPITKAKILANSKLPGEFAKAVGDAGHVVETSTDLMELKQKQSGTSEEDVG